VHLCRKVEILAIDTGKNTFLMTILIKLTLGNIFIKEKKNHQGGIKVVELSAFEKYISCFVTVAPPWWFFFTFMKMLPNVSFISMVIKKVFLPVSIAKISTFLQRCTL
jgi:hypothetical protein